MKTEVFCSPEASELVQWSNSSCSSGVLKEAKPVRKMDGSHSLQRRTGGGGEQEAAGELLSWGDDPEKSGVGNGRAAKEVYSAGRRGGEFSSCSCVPASRGAVPALLGERGHHTSLMGHEGDDGGEKLHFCCEREFGRGEFRPEAADVPSADLQGLDLLLRDRRVWEGWEPRATPEMVPSGGPGSAAWAQVLTRRVPIGERLVHVPS